MMGANEKAAATYHPALTACGNCHLGHETLIHDLRDVIDTLVQMVSVDRGWPTTKVRLCVGLGPTGLRMVPPGTNGAPGGIQGAQSGTSEGETA